MVFSLEFFVEKLKSLLRPIKRIIDEDVIDRLLSYSINKKRLIAESKKRISVNLNETILFNTQYHWHYSWIGYCIAAALRYRGIDSVMLLCDGLPYCERETISLKRPSCASCYRLTKRHSNVFGLKSYSLNGLLDDVDKEKCCKIAYESTICDLETLIKDDVNIGVIAFRNFTHYFRGVYEITKDKEDLFRRCVYSALLVSVATDKLVKNINPFKLITANGKYIQSAISLDVAKKYKIPYYTWDVFTQHTATCFAKNEVAHDQRIDDLWGTLKNFELNKEQDKKLAEYFKLQSESKNTPYNYYNENIVNDEIKINQSLGLRDSAKVISLFPNVEWDSTAMGLDGAYQSMQDWIFSMIDFVSHNSEFELIIRAHPGELKVPYNLTSTAPICDVITQKIKHLPSNIHLIRADENISSYSISKLSDVSMVYTSTLGIEFALKGIRPWVAANPYYNNKGFSLDILSHQQVEALLKGNTLRKYLTVDEIELAKKFAYVVRFRRLFSFPLFDDSGKFLLERWEDLSPDKNAVIENICQFIDDKRNYIDIGPLNDKQ